jgi:very-short-patch-repair endonuclease
MKEITEKLHSKALESFRPMIEQMAGDGCSEEQIIRAYQAQIKIKTNQYYDKLKEMASLKKIFSELGLKETADSKAEAIFYGLMQNSGIKFTFQHTIGPYKADYLVMGFLIIEIDGPQHNKNHDEHRDKYLRKMGYKIIRIPIWVLVSCPEAAIQEIKEAVNKGVGT